MARLLRFLLHLFIGSMQYGVNYRRNRLPIGPVGRIPSSFVECGGQKNLVPPNFHYWLSFLLVLMLNNEQ